MVARLLFWVEAAVPPQNNFLIKKVPPPTPDRCERRLFPPEQSLANDKIDRPAIYFIQKRSDEVPRSAVTLHHCDGFLFCPTHGSLDSPFVLVRLLQILAAA